ncbi:MAG: hypothetical protein KJ822_12820, partial [Proteobacteria bacterium]|nr:hypothetical protein [Pseudomonadota bacterium]
QIFPVSRYSTSLGKPETCHYQNLLIIQMSYGYELDNEKGACGGKCENLGVEEIQKAVRGRILNTS